MSRGRMMRSGEAVGVVDTAELVDLSMCAALYFARQEGHDQHIAARNYMAWPRHFPLPLARWTSPADRSVARRESEVPRGLEEAFAARRDPDHARSFGSRH